ncbi:polysaccharide transporter [Aeromonas veronii]|uniref:BexC/CtrB/KpsE family polysaccharide export inner-membrane protein n=1 Tax=Aeromonas veronii AMC34 TaxID=1073383 RepID=K1JGS1_AERVE|nr:polysaccharide transporter [Aeromonas veronii]EKB18659.1 BexC/CtrB/KpsE family polysaccharide export inner-membrane protein [Aeromonas veronii AMC34]
MTKANLTALFERKLRKLKRDPKLFLIDSKGYQVAHHSWKKAVKLGSFLWVVVCFSLAALYYGAIASDRYVSQASLIIKQADQLKMLPDALSMLGLGGSNHQDVLVIQDYLKSWDMLDTLDKELQLKKHYQSDSADMFSRLPEDATREEFLAFYRDHLTISLDELSGVLTVNLQAFEPEYAKRVVTLMLKESEGFINRLSHQVAMDQLKFVETEVARSHERLLQEREKMLAFQNQHQLMSPEATSTAMIGVVSELEAELVRQDAELKRLQIYMNPSAPDVIAVKDRVEALTRQLAQEKMRLTSGDKKSLNEVNADYQAVQVQTQLAADVYKTGLVSMEQARVEAYRKLKHLLVVSQPSVAEEAEYPRRLYNLATIGVLLCLFYGLVVMGLATLREHQD